jgi:hypothetical protein
MGKLADFDKKCLKLDNLIEQYNLTLFVETGCFYGDSTKHASSKGFKEIYSCDIDPEMIAHCQKTLANKDTRIHLVLNDSLTFLKELLPKLDKEQNCLFFLDAHLPGHDKRSNYKDIQLSELTFPLEQELDIIYNLRNKSKDVIIIDDLRIYEDNQYDSGNWKERYQFNLTSDFLNQYPIEVKKFMSKEGYALLLPR